MLGACSQSAFGRSRGAAASRGGAAHGSLELCSALGLHQRPQEGPPSNLRRSSRAGQGGGALYNGARAGNPQDSHGIVEICSALSSFLSLLWSVFWLAPLFYLAMACGLDAASLNTYTYEHIYVYTHTCLP